MEKLQIPGYQVTVGYGKKPRPIDPPMDPGEAGRTLGGGFLLELSENQYLLVGTNCHVTFEAPVGGTDTVFVADKREMLLQDGALKEGRILNGDQRNVTGIGLTPAVLKVTLDKHH